jgi:hypothetical protein
MSQMCYFQWKLLIEYANPIDQLIFLGRRMTNRRVHQVDKASQLFEFVIGSEDFFLGAATLHLVASLPSVRAAVIPIKVVGQVSGTSIFDRQWGDFDEHQRRASRLNWAKCHPTGGRGSFLPVSVS